MISKHMTFDNTSLEKKSLAVVIVGSGFGGLCMGIRLKRAGIDNFVILEKADHLGGTWRENTYPGAACDVPSVLYSYSFEQKNDWSQRYAQQPEILRYLEHCAQKYGLLPHLKLNQKVTRAYFDQAQSLWTIELASGETIAAKILVPACGQLHHPSIPNLQGLERFKGKQFHSSRWDHNYSLEGKKVAVIGNGASAIQFIPHVIEQAEKTVVFQRSPNWIMRKGRKNLYAFEQWAHRYVPFALKVRRLWVYLTSELRLLAFNQGSAVGRYFKAFLSRKIRRQVQVPSQQSVLIPDYEVGCKRILLSNDYYRALGNPNAELVSNPIERFTKDGIVTQNGHHHELDAVIFGTGFKADSFMFPIQIEGLNNVSLADVWKTGPEAYFGMMVAGFPNMFMLYGPNSGLGHNSIVYMIERQVDYVMRMLRMLQDNQLDYADVTAEAMESHNQTLQKRMRRMVWNASCMSWYKDKFGKIIVNWPSFSWDFAWQTRRIKQSDFHWRRRSEPAPVPQVSQQMAIAAPAAPKRQRPLEDDLG